MADDYVFVTFMVTEDGEQGHPMRAITKRVMLTPLGEAGHNSLEALAARIGEAVQDKVSERRG